MSYQKRIPGDDKIRHKAGLMRPSDGAVSAECYRTPRAINLKTAIWVLEWDRVTCKKCLAMRSSIEA